MFEDKCKPKSLKNQDFQAIGQEKHGKNQEKIVSSHLSALIIRNVTNINIGQEHFWTVAWFLTASVPSAGTNTTAVSGRQLGPNPAN